MSCISNFSLGSKCLRGHPVDKLSFDSPYHSGYTISKEVITMKKQDILSLVKLLLVPSLLILLGLILVVNPDAASALIAKIIGCVLILGAVCTGAYAIFSQSGKIGKGILAVGLAVTGGWLTANPLLLAAWIGRVLGVLVILNSIPDLIYARKQGQNVLFDAIAATVGAVLVLMPMTASRLVFSACGVAVMIIGLVMFLDRLRNQRRLQPGDDPNIIDAL